MNIAYAENNGMVCSHISLPGMTNNMQVTFDIERKRTKSSGSVRRFNIDKSAHAHRDPLYVDLHFLLDGFEQSIMYRVLLDQIH